MPILDKKGRLFGKVNILDATIAVLLILAVVLYLGLLRRTVSMKEAFDRALVDMQVTMRVPAEMYGMIKSGDKSVNDYLGFHAIITRVEKLAGENPTEQELNLHPGPNLNLWLRMKVYLEGDQIIYENRPIKMGSELPFTGERYDFTGRVIRIRKVGQVK